MTARVFQVASMREIDALERGERRTQRAARLWEAYAKADKLARELHRLALEASARIPEPVSTVPPISWADDATGRRE